MLYDSLISKQNNHKAKTSLLLKKAIDVLDIRFLRCKVYRFICFYDSIFPYCQKIKKLKTAPHTEIH